MAEVPTPKYKIGDTVYNASSVPTGAGYDCPDCNKTGKWKAVAPTGVEVDIPCPRCDGCGTLQQHAYSACPSGPLTIGQVRIEWPKSKFDSERDAVNYMCEETGIGSGSVYYESRLYSTREEAQARSEAMAAEQNRKLDESEPERLRRREIYSYQITQALADEHADRTRKAEYAYECLLRRILDLDTYPLAHKLDADGNETSDWLHVSLTNEQIEAVQNSLLRGDEKALRQLAEHRSLAA